MEEADYFSKFTAGELALLKVIQEASNLANEARMNSAKVADALKQIGGMYDVITPFIDLE